MRLQPVIKAPFRWTRTAWRAGRRVLQRVVPPQAPAEEASTPAPAPEAVAPAAPEPEPPRIPLAIQVLTTPNPDARKLVADRVLVEDGSIVANGPEGHPAWIGALFAVGGVRTVFATNDFVTVTRTPDGPGWDTLAPALVQTLQAVRG